MATNTGDVHAPATRRPTAGPPRHSRRRARRAARPCCNRADRPGLGAHAPDPPDRGLHPRRHHRHRGAHPRRAALAAARPAGDHREPPRRRRQRGRRRGREGRAGRPHPADADGERGGHQLPALRRADALPARGFRGHLAGGARAQRDLRQSRRAREHARGARGAGARESGADEHRQLGRGHLAAHDGRAAEAGRQPRPDACALPRRGADAAGDHRRAHRGRRGQPALRHRASARGAAAPARRHHRHALALAARRADHGRGRVPERRGDGLVRRGGPEVVRRSGATLDS